MSITENPLMVLLMEASIPYPLLASVINEVTKTFKHLKEFGHLISSYSKSTDMSTRELSVPYMAITYT